MLRQNARTSQADFLSSVLPAQDFDFGTAVPGNGHSTATSTPTFLQRVSPPRTPNGPAIDDAVVASGLSSNRAEGPEAGLIATASLKVSSIDATAVGSSFSDKQAVARWTSMRRLQEQSVGLGSAADHQLTRALQLCRDLRGLKVRVHQWNASWQLVAAGRRNRSSNSSSSGQCPPRVYRVCPHARLPPLTQFRP